MSFKFSNLPAGALLLATLCASSGVTAATPHAESSLYAVLHIDINPSQTAKALPILRRFVAEASREQGVASIELLTQEGGTNHFTVLEVIRSRADYAHFIEAASVRAMRAAIQPMLGSPFDERLHSRVVTNRANSSD